MARRNGHTQSFLSWRFAPVGRAKLLIAVTAAVLPHTGEQGPQSLDSRILPDHQQS
jgi:hypothetical protein